MHARVCSSQNSTPAALIHNLDFQKKYLMVNYFLYHINPWYGFAIPYDNVDNSISLYGD